MTNFNFYSAMFQASVVDLNGDFFVQYFRGISPESFGDNEIYYSNEEKGIELVTNSTRELIALHFFNDSSSDFSPFAGPTPIVDRFNLTPSEIIAQFPNSQLEQGGGEVLPILGKSKDWIKFTFDYFHFHLQFGIEGTICQITLSRIEEEYQD